MLCPLDIGCSENEIKLDDTLADAVLILAQHNIYSAPVVDVDWDASWICPVPWIDEMRGGGIEWVGEREKWENKLKIEKLFCFSVKLNTIKHSDKTLTGGL